MDDTNDRDEPQMFFTGNPSEPMRVRYIWNGKAKKLERIMDRFDAQSGMWIRDSDEPGIVPVDFKAIGNALGDAFSKSYTATKEFRRSADELKRTMDACLERMDRVDVNDFCDSLEREWKKKDGGTE